MINTCSSDAARASASGVSGAHTIHIFAGTHGMFVYVHACTHTHTHTYINNIHTYIHTYIYACLFLIKHMIPSLHNLHNQNHFIMLRAISSRISTVDCHITSMLSFWSQEILLLLTYLVLKILILDMTSRTIPSTYKYVLGVLLVIDR